MTLFRAILVFHIAAGAVGVILGPVAMTARKGSRLHARAGEIYHWVMLAVCVSATGLAWLDWNRLWWFLPIAAGSYAFALVGYVAAKRRWPGWLAAHVSGQGGSYIAMLTAVLVVNWQMLTGTRGPLVAVAVDPPDAGRQPDHRLGQRPSPPRAPTEGLPLLIPPRVPVVHAGWVACPTRWPPRDPAQSFRLTRSSRGTGREPEAPPNSVSASST